MSALEIFAITTNLNKSDSSVIREEQYEAIEKVVIEIIRKSPAVIFFQEAFADKVQKNLKVYLGDRFQLLSKPERSSLWNGVITSDDFVENIQQLNESVRKRILERLRKSDQDFFTEDVRVIICTATIKNSGGKTILLASYHGPHSRKKNGEKEEIFCQFLTFLVSCQREKKCDHVLAGADSNLTGDGADGFADRNKEILTKFGLKIIVGDRANLKKIDCFILSNNLTMRKVQTFDVDLKKIGHYPVGLRVEFTDVQQIVEGAGDVRVRNCAIGKEGPGQRLQPTIAKTTDVKPKRASRSTAAKKPVPHQSPIQTSSNGARRVAPQTVTESTPLERANGVNRSSNSAPSDGPLPRRLTVPKKSSTRKPSQTASSSPASSNVSTGRSTHVGKDSKVEAEPEVRRSKGQKIRQSQAI